MRAFKLVNHSSGRRFDLEMWHRLDDARREHRRQLVSYVALILTSGILAFALLFKLSGG